MSDDPTDEELMAAYAAGDANAFDRLFGRHRRPLFTFLLHRTESRALAEDLFQEVFLRLIRGRERYRPAGSFRAWLFTMAHNALTDDRRRAALRAAETVDEAPEPERTASRAERSSDPVARTHAAHLGRRLAAALRHLPADQRDVFLLRERAGLDFASIARATGAALPTVKSRMRYALAALRRRLADDLPSLTECLHD